MKVFSPKRYLYRLANHIMVIQSKLNLTGHSDGVTCVDVFPDCSRIVSGSLDGFVKIWDAKTGLELLELTGHCISMCMAVFPDCSRIVSGNYDGSMKVWGMVYYPANSVFILLMKLPLNEDMVQNIIKYCIAPKDELEALWNKDK